MQTDLLSYVESLTVPEVDRKAQLEATIERGMQTFVEVGLALMEIRDGRLYRAEFGTFEEYCQERWGWTDRRARMLISAAGVMDNLKTGTTVPVLPANEAQVRPLATLPPDLQRAAWREAVDTAPNGMVYWRDTTLRKIAELSDVLPGVYPNVPAYNQAQLSY